MRPSLFLVCSMCVGAMVSIVDFAAILRNLFGYRTSEDMSENASKEVLKQRLPTGLPTESGFVYFSETFASAEYFKKRWVISNAVKAQNSRDSISKYDGVWTIEEPLVHLFPNDRGLVLKSEARHHAISVLLDESFTFHERPFVFQYEVNFQKGQSCGGAYVKFLSQIEGLNLTDFSNETPYTIMFGPDVCEQEPKLHFIMRHKNPITGLYEEKKLKEPDPGLQLSYFNDRRTHLYTLVLKPDNSFQIYTDQRLYFTGNLLRDLSPPINPSKEIFDDNDKKPADWDDRKGIPDPNAVKPADWIEDNRRLIQDPNATKPKGWLDNEPNLISDPDARRPSTWNTEVDGEWGPPKMKNPKCTHGCGTWVAPLTKNPNYRKKWKPPMISNQNYRGVWKGRKIQNKDYFEDLHPFNMTAIAGLGIELWSMQNDILFDNFILTDNKSVADMWGVDSWRLKSAQELRNSTIQHIRARRKLDDLDSERSTDPEKKSTDPGKSTDPEKSLEKSTYSLWLYLFLLFLLPPFTAFIRKYQKTNAI